MQSNDIQSFIMWISTYDHQALQNEDDVETKCVLPLFHHLAYPDTHRRGKYALTGYRPGQPGRKSEIDQIFFAKADSTDTALVIVEAKHPQKQNLDAALEQAQFYGERLKPLLLLVTNGYRIVVLKRCRYRDDEYIFDGLITDLKNSTEAANFYALLNFETVSRIRQQVIDDLTHAQFVELERMLRTYPDIQDILATGDFTPHRICEDRMCTIVRPKVAIEGTLPVGFGEGSCEISFSHILRRGLSISLTHREIMSQFMIGLGTTPQWNTRPFIQQEQDGNFLVQLGRTTTLLSAEEAHDLCTCVDEFAEAYRAVLYDAEDTLETWDYHVIPTFDGPGLYFLSVRPWLWTSMRQFAETFEWGNGHTQWHIFERYPPALRISHPTQDHAFIYGLPRLPNVISHLPGYIHLVYVQPEFILEETAKQTSNPWQQSVGVQGLWSARYAHHWIKHEFIPVLRKKHIQFIGRWKNATACEDDYSRVYIPTHSIQNAEQLVAYLRDIHLWLAWYSVQPIATAGLRNTFSVCLNLARYADPTHINLHYTASHLGPIEGVDQSEYTSFQYGKDCPRIRAVYAQILTLLQAYIDHIHCADFEHSRKADYVLRSIITILEQGHITCSQAILNQATHDIHTLWRQCRFESRHVLPIEHEPH